MWKKNNLHETQCGRMYSLTFTLFACLSIVLFPQWTPLNVTWLLLCHLSIISWLNHLTNLPLIGGKQQTGWTLVCLAGIREIHTKFEVYLCNNSVTSYRRRSDRGWLLGVWRAKHLLRPWSGAACATGRSNIMSCCCASGWGGKKAHAPMCFY